MVIYETFGAQKTYMNQVFLLNEESIASRLEGGHEQEEDSYNQLNINHL